MDWISFSNFLSIEDLEKIHQNSFPFWKIVHGQYVNFDSWLYATFSPSRWRFDTLFPFHCLRTQRSSSSLFSPSIHSSTSNQIDVLTSIAVLFHGILHIICPPEFFWIKSEHQTTHLYLGNWILQNNNKSHISPVTIGLEFIFVQLWSTSILLTACLLWIVTDTTLPEQESLSA